MNNGWVVNEKNELEEMRKNASLQQAPAIKFVANILSYIFHPVFVPVYLVLFMVYLHPWLFIGVDPFNKTRVVLMSLVMFTLFPLVTVSLLKGLKFIESIRLKTQKDRVIPLIACGIWYFWITYVWWNSNKTNDGLFIPKIAVALALATFLASWLGLMVNIVMKVSLHAISMGVMLAFIFLLAFSDSLNYGPYIVVALLIAGVVCSSRFIVSDHSAKEVYTGLVVGIGSMLIANLFV
ncbi:MAG: hypothetical protein AAB221_01840 [Bacteroidota bacterium]